MYKRRYKFSHMQLECIPLPKKIGELAPIYFKVSKSLRYTVRACPRVCKSSTLPVFKF